MQTDYTNPLTYTKPITEFRRDLRYQFPSTILRGLVAEGGGGQIHHSEKENAFTTEANKDYGTHLFMIPSPINSGDELSKVVTVIQKKKFFLKYTHISKIKYNGELNGNPPASFSVTWKLKASTDIDLPIKGTLTFHDIRINRGLPLEEQQRISRIFLVHRSHM